MSEGKVGQRQTASKNNFRAQQGMYRSTLGTAGPTSTFSSHLPCWALLYRGVEDTVLACEQDQGDLSSGHFSSLLSKPEYYNQTYLSGKITRCPCLLPTRELPQLLHLHRVLG